MLSSTVWPFLAVPGRPRQLFTRKRLHHRRGEQQRVLQQTPKPLFAHVLAIRFQGQQVGQLHRVRRLPFDHRAHGKRQFLEHRLAQFWERSCQPPLHFFSQFFYSPHRSLSSKFASASNST
jgi:hypothetical protein